MMISLDNIYKSFGGNTVLSGISFFSEASATAIMGESGSGKTTLLRLIAGLEKADGGKIEVNGSVAFAFAEPRLFENVSVLENVACVMSGSKDENIKTASDILCSLGLCGEENKKPAELSTGMAQRVSLARAVASNRDIYLLDEPLRGLDEQTKEKAGNYLRSFLLGKCAVIVTHSTDEAELLGAKILNLKNGSLK